MNAKRGAAGLRGWRGLACLAIVGVFGLPGLAKASPGCQALNGQSGTIAGYGYVQLLSNSQQVNRGDAVTLTTPGQIFYGGSFLQMMANGNTVSGTESGSGAGADNLVNYLSSSATYRITCVSAGATISGASPASATAGSTVTISGTGFWGASQVLFGAIPATSFTVNYNGSVYPAINATAPNGSGTVTITVVTDAGTYTGGSFTFVPPSANPVSATVAFGSSNNSIPLSITGMAIAVAVASAPAHGSATASGTSITYTPASGYSGSDSFTYTAKNNAGKSSPAQVSITVSQMTQTITFANPGTQNFGTMPTLTASASSGLPVSFTSSTTAVCTVTSGGALTAVSAGTCTVNANQAGNSAYSAAPQVSQSFAIATVVPGAPTIGTAAASNAQATVNFAPPAFTGGASIAQYTATSSPGGLTGTCASSPCVVAGLTNGTAYTFTVTATNAAGTGAPSAASNAVAPVGAPTIGTASLPAGVDGVAYSQSIVASGGSSPYTFSVSAGSLPPGLALSGAGLLSGTPTGGGSYTFTIEVTDSASRTGTQFYNLIINAATVTLSPASLSMSDGASFNQTVTASGGIGPYIYSVVSGSLPAGLSLSSAGILSGTPTAADAYSFTIEAQDSSIGSGPYTGTQAYSGTVAAPTLKLQPSGSSLNASYAQAYSQTFNASGGSAPYTYALSGTLPNGLSFNPGTATLSGTPTQSGTFNFTVTAIDHSTGTGAPFSITQNYTLTASQPAISMTPAAAPTGIVGTAYTVTVAASGGAAPYSYKITSGSLPPGLALSSSGTLSGTPTGAGSFNINILATDQNGSTGAQSYTVQIASATLSISPANLGAATAEASYSVSLGTTGGTQPYTYTISSGSLPPGLSLSSSGSLSGTPTAAGAYNFTIRSTDSSTGTGAPFTATQAYAFQVNAPSISITPGALPVSQMGAPYSQQLTASGGNGSYSFSVSAGALPAGLTLSSSGLLAGTPTVSGAFNVTVTAKDGLNFTGSQAYTLNVGLPAVPVVAAASATTAYNTPTVIDLTHAVTGIDITAVTVAAQPAHGTVSVSGETATYTPSPTYYGGTDSFTYTATNPGGTSAPATVTITVGTPSAPTVAAKSAGTPYNTAASIDLAGSISGVDITAVAIGTAPAHGTVSVSGETVTYTPSSTYYGGSDSFTYTATNPGGTSAAATVTIAVGAPIAPTVAAKSVTTPYNTAASIDLTGSVTGIDITAVTVATQPAHGTVSVSGETVAYTPSSTYYGGTDSFTYTATNPGGTSASATVSIVVGAPVAPTVAAKSATTPYDTAANIDLASSITGVDITAVTVASQPVHGTVSVSGETVTYTPFSTYYGGSDSFTYTATNPGGTSIAATVTITVGVPAAPTAAARSVATPYNTAASIDLSGSIVGVDITTVTMGSAPAHGTASVSGETVTYTPSSTYYGGTDSFTYTATNPGGTSVPATVTITVGVPAAPTVAAKSATTPYNTAASIDLANSVTGVDITTVTIGATPAHGTVSVSGETVTYTPASSFYGGTDSFTYTATNSGGVSAPAVVTVTVSPLSVPMAQAIDVSTTSGTPVLIAATAMASGPQPLTGASVASAPAHGTASADGEQITYAPGAGFVGTDSFTYRVANHFGSSAPATVTVQVTAAGRLGAATGTRTVTAAPGTAVTVNMAQIVPDTYVSAVLTGLSPGNAGNITLSQPATLTFTSAASFRGLVQISATLTAASGRLVTIDVLVLVSSQPDPSKNPDVLGLVNAQTEQAQRFAQSQLDNIEGRLENVHDGGTALFSNTLSISLDGKALQAPRQDDPNVAATQPRGDGPFDPDASLFGSRYAALGQPSMGDANGKSTGAMGPESSSSSATSASSSTGSGPKGLGLWIAGTANFGTFDAYRQAAGFDSDNIAVNVGVDQRISPRALVGLSLGYNHDNADISSNGTRSIANGYSVAMYGSYQPTAQTYLDLVLGGGGLSFDSRRYDADSGSFLTGQRNGSQWFGALTAGYEYHNQGGLLLSPYLRVEQSLSELNGFSEQGAATAALSYGSETLRMSLAVLGLRASEQYTLDWGVLVPRARLEIGHDFEGTSNVLLGYAFIPSAGSWSVLTNPYAANGTSVQLGLGLDMELRHNLRLTTDYEYLTQPHAHDQMIRFGLDKQF